MKIGIDIDGVLTDIEQWQLDYGSKFYYENYGLGIKNYKGYETNEIFDVDIKLDDEFWNKYFRDYSINVEARKFANEVIDKLKEDGHEIYIITARGSFLSHSADVMTIEENRNIVLNWLKINQIHYDNIIFSPEDKLEICKQNNIDLMITHIPPFRNKNNSRGNNSCYYTEVKEYKSSVWIYGHDHKEEDIIINNTRLVSNPWGYDTKEFKIKTLTLTK